MKIPINKKVIHKEIEGVHFRTSDRWFQLMGAKQQKAAPPVLELTLGIFERPTLIWRLITHDAVPEYDELCL